MSDKTHVIQSKEGLEKIDNLDYDIIKRMFHAIPTETLMNIDWENLEIMQPAFVEYEKRYIAKHKSYPDILIGTPERGMFRVYRELLDLVKRSNL